MLRALGPLLVLALGAGVIFTADLDSVRFSSVSNSHDCSTEQLVNLPSKVDLVFLGSSRVRRGIAPDVIPEASNGRFTDNFNLARARRIILRSESIVSHVLESRRPAAIIAEVDLDLLRLGAEPEWNWKADEPGFLTYSEIWTNAPGDESGRPWVTNVLQGWHDKIQLALMRHFSGITFNVLKDMGTTSRNVCFNADFDIPSEKKIRSLKKIKDRNLALFTDPTTALDERMVGADTPAARVELKVLDRIRQKAAKAGVPFFVIRHQAFTDPPLSADAVEGVRTFIPEFLYPPEALVREMSTLYSDGTHMNREGRVLYTRWLTQTILAEVGAP